MQQETQTANEPTIGELPAEIPPVVEQQQATNKEVKKQVSAKAKTKKPAKAKSAAKAAASSTGSEDKLIKSESNPPRPDKKYIEKGDLMIPVEE